MLQLLLVVVFLFFQISDDSNNIILLSVSSTSYPSVLLKTSDQELTLWDGCAPKKVKLTALKIALENPHMGCR